MKTANKPVIVEVDYAELEQRILAWALQKFGVRADHIPKGVIMSCSYCPLARLISLAQRGVQVLGPEITYIVSGPKLYKIVPIPKYVEQFLSDFDLGKYPGLIE